MATRLLYVLSSPVVAIFDGLLRELVEASVDARALVRQQEVEAVRQRLDDLLAEVGARSTEVEALRQALDARADDADLGEVLGMAPSATLVDEAEARRLDLSKRVGRLAGALDSLTHQVGEVAARHAALGPTQAQHGTA